MIKQIFIGVISSAVLGACAYLIPKTDAAEVEPVSYTRVSVEGEFATTAEKSACTAVGGEIMRVGLLGYENCVQTYADAGKACADASDCLGQCLSAPGEDASPGDMTAGECKATDSPFGCHTTIADGRAEGTLCVD